MDSEASKDKISALLSLISSATVDAIAEYERTGAGVPAPGVRTPHPLDSMIDALALKKAIRTLEGACDQLCTTLAQPMHTLVKRSVPFESAGLRLVLDLKIADILETHPEGLPAPELAEKTKVSSEKLSHVLRLLATFGCFTEVSPNVFANNRLSLALLSSNPVSDFIGLLTNECTRAVHALPDVMVHPDSAFANDVQTTAFSYATRDDKSDPGAGLTFFDWLKVHPREAQRFNQGMIGGSYAAGSMSIVKVVPWSTFPPGATFCDIGSGVGGISMLLSKAHNLKVTLQDLNGPLEGAKNYWTSNFPEAIEGQQVSFVPLDFLKQIPVKGQDIYYIKSVLLDWPDVDAITILRNVSAAMAPHSRLFIHEYVLRHLDETESGTVMEKAPEPLLPNYGAGGLMGHRQDMIMLALFNSRERTYDEFIHLGDQAGLRLEKVWDIGETSLLEFKLRDAAYGV